MWRCLVARRQTAPMTNHKWKRWGTELRHHRKSLGLAQATLAKTMHLAGPTLSSFERGTRTPGASTLLPPTRPLPPGAC